MDSYKRRSSVAKRTVASFAYFRFVAAAVADTSIVQPNKSSKFFPRNNRENFKGNYLSIIADNVRTFDIARNSHRRRIAQRISIIIRHIHIILRGILISNDARFVYIVRRMHHLLISAADQISVDFFPRRNV